MRWRAQAILLLSLLALACAQSTRDAIVCDGTSGTIDDRISACTRAIESGDLSPKLLAEAFYNRGVEWTANRDDDRAIADFTESLRLNPQDAMAFRSRGIAWITKKNYERAILDLDQAVR